MCIKILLKKKPHRKSLYTCIVKKSLDIDEEIIIENQNVEVNLCSHAVYYDVI